ncbi:hypothetical protein PHMEG_00014590 [Phytophthora megakarya]|uniref:Uncharacterized protein n=1 Tax=Phytophthora megakarya TaxID=4795 RepID=A0A225W4G0_9STRA|nr:hypothetical protein PHMEG_00014590 [Phytophthora megakarya]
MADDSRDVVDVDDDGPGEYEDPDDPYTAVTLIRAAGTITTRPVRPKTPMRHPSTNWINRYKPDAPIDPDVNYPVVRANSANSVGSGRNTFKVYLASDSDLSFNAFYGINFRGAGANEKNLCFLYSFQAAYYGLGRLDFVNKIPERDGDFVRRFGELCSSSASRYYIVYCAQDLVERCVTLVVGGPGDPVQIYDDYQEDNDPPCKFELLSQIEWLDKVYALYHVALPQPKRPKKTKKSKK